MCASMFDLKNLKDAFGTAFKERPHGLRKYIILLTIIFVLEILLQNGQHSTTFLFVRKGMWIVIVFAISNFYLIGFLCKSIRTCIYIIHTTLLFSAKCKKCKNSDVLLSWVLQYFREITQLLYQDVHNVHWFHMMRWAWIFRFYLLSCEMYPFSVSTLII